MKIVILIAFLLTSMFAYDIKDTVKNVTTEVQEKKVSSWKKFVGHFNVSRQGKKVYAYVSTKVKRNIKNIKSKVFSRDKNDNNAVAAIPQAIAVEDERKTSVLKQFIAKADILESARVKQEIINVEDEIISFFNSFKYTKKQPINIE